jgi:magnesium chelatase accessory protein
VPPPFVQDLLAPAFRTAGLSLLASALGRRHFVTDSLLKSTGSDVPPWSRRVYRKLMGNPAHVGAVLQLMAAWDPDPVSRRLPEVDVPGLVIAGEADHWIPMKDVTAAVDRLPDVELHVLPGRGHVLHEEAPREVFTLLHPFLRKHLLPEPNDTPVG